MSRIAIVTEDGVQVSRHFGMAPWYLVFTVENGQIVAEERREKPHHTRHPQPGEQHHHHHGDMFAPIADCEVLIAGGMGQPAYQSALAAGLDVILAAGEVNAVLAAYLNGTLTSDPRRVHAAHHHHH